MKMLPNINKLKKEIVEFYSSSDTGRVLSFILILLVFYAVRNLLLFVPGVFCVLLLLVFLSLQKDRVKRRVLNTTLIVFSIVLLALNYFYIYCFNLSLIVAGIIATNTIIADTKKIT